MNGVAHDALDMNGQSIPIDGQTVSVA